MVYRKFERTGLRFVRKNSYNSRTIILPDACVKALGWDHALSMVLLRYHNLREFREYLPEELHG